MCRRVLRSHVENLTLLLHNVAAIDVVVVHSDAELNGCGGVLGLWEDLLGTFVGRRLQPIGLFGAGNPQVVNFATRIRVTGHR